MADGVAWCVEEEEGAVFEVVDCLEAADLEVGVGEVEFDEFTIGKIGLHDRAVRVGRVAGQEVGFEAGSDDEVRRRWEFAGIALVVPVPVAPDDCFDGSIRARNGVGLKDLPD